MIQRIFRFLLCAAALGTVCLAPLTTVFAQTDDDEVKRGPVLQLPASEVRQENLKTVNSPHNDARPTISNSETTLYFTSDKGGKQALYFSHRLSDKTWSAPELYFELPGKENISSLSVTSDGKFAVMGACNRNDGILNSCDIYYGDIQEGKLVNIQSFGHAINSEWWDAQPSISRDGQNIFFSSDRKGGKGGTDIYMISRDANGGWTAPVDLGFNSSDNEMAPEISADGESLYFTAEGLKGSFGGFDIYVTHRTGPNSWTTPENLGAGVNSKDDEMFVAVPPAEDAIYISSDRRGGEGGFDIYRVYPNPVQPAPKIIVVKGRLVDAESGQPIAAAGDFDIRLTPTNEALQNTGSGAEFAATVPLGKMITVRAGAEGYVTSTAQIQAPNKRDANGYTQDIKLAPAHARIDGHVTNVFTHKAVAAKVILEDLSDNQPSGHAIFTVDAQLPNTNFTFNVNPLRKYRLSTTVQDYEPWTTEFEVPTGREALVRVEKEIRLTPSNIESVTLNFETAKHDVKKDEAAKLERFIGQVKENPYVRIEVLGHTDDVGSDELNEKLSERRAMAVEDYLLSRGVARDQLAVVKGFGKAAPLVPGTSDEDRAKNRRVEVRIVGKQP